MDYVKKIEALAKGNASAFICAKLSLEESEKDLKEYKNSDSCSKLGILKREEEIERKRIAFREARKNLNDGQKQIAKWREAYSAELQEKYRPKPDEVSQNTIALINSDILTVSDYETLISEASPTMRKILGKSALSKADVIEKRQGRNSDSERLRYLAHETSQQNELNMFDSYRRLYDRIVNRPELVSHWDAITGDNSEK